MSTARLWPIASPWSNDGLYEMSYRSLISLLIISEKSII